MTIQYVGGQTATIAGGTTATTITYALTGGLAATPRAGDLVVLSYGISSTLNLTYGLQTAGFTEVAELYSNDTYDANLSVSWKYLTAAETNVIVDATGTAADNGTVTIQVFRYVDPYAPLDVTATNATGNNGGVVNPAAITPVTAGAWIIAIGCAASNITHTFTAAYLSNLIQTSNASGTNRAATAAGCYTSWASGSYDGAAWTNASSVNTHSWASVTLALRPAPLVSYAEDDFELATTNLAVNAGTRIQNVGQSRDWGYQAAIGYTNAAAASYEPLETSWLRYRYRFRPNVTAFPATGSADIILFRPRTVSGSAFVTQKITAAAGGGLTLKTVNETAAATIGSTTSLVNNRWYQVECLVNKTGGIVQVWVDGTLVTNVSAQSVPAGTMDVLDVMAYAGGTAGAAGNIHYDDFEVAASAAAWPAQRKVFPSLVGSVATGEVVTASVTHPITLPAGLTAGEMVVVYWQGNTNYNSSIAGSGWQVAMQSNYSGCFMLLWKISDGSDSLTITSAFAMQSSHQSFRVRNGAYLMFDWSTFGASVTNQNLGTNSPDIGADNLLYGQVLALTGQIVATAPPSNHELVGTFTAANATGKSLSLALRQNCVDGDVTASGFTHAASSSVGLIMGFAITGYAPSDLNHPLAMQQVFTAQSATQTSHAITIPPNTAAGDVILVATTFSGAVTIGGATGWRTVVEQSNLTVTGTLYWKIAAGANETITLTTSGAAQRRSTVYVLRNAGRVKATTTTTGNTASIALPQIDLFAFWNKNQRRNLRFMGAAFVAPFDLYNSYFSRRYQTVTYGTYGNPAADWIATQFIAEPYKMTTLQYIGWGGGSYSGTTSNITEAFSTSFTPEITGDQILPGDLVVLTYSVSSITGYQPTVVSPGWTTYSAVQTGALYDVGFVVAWKFMGATPDASVTLGQTGATTNAGDINFKVFRGADPATPVTTPQFLGGRAAEPMKTLPVGDFKANAIGITVMNRASGATPDALLRQTDGWQLLWGSVADTYSIACSFYHDEAKQDPFWGATRWTGNDTAADTSWLGVSFAVNPAYRPSAQKWDWETNSFLGLYDWSTSNTAIVTGAGQTGTYAGRLNLVSSGAFDFTQLLYERTLYVQYRFKLSLTAFAAEDIQTIVLRDSNQGPTAWQQVNVTTGGVLTLQTGYLYGSGIAGSTVISNDSWYTVAMKVVMSESSGAIETRLNGTTVHSVTGQTSGFTRQYINSIFGKGYLSGGGSAASTGFLYLDEIEYSILDWPAYVVATGRPKFWNGSAFVQKPLKVWTGAAWLEKPVKVWNGSAWVTVN